MTEAVREVQADDGYPLRYRYWEGEPSKGWVILLHGSMSNTSWLRELAEALQGRGFTVVGHDRRGSGLNPQGRGDLPSAEVLFSDLARVVSEAPEGVPIHIFGWCWGGLVALNFLQEHADRIRSLVLAAPCLYLQAKHGEPFLKHWQLTSDTADPHEPFIRLPIVEHMFTAGPALQDIILRDESRVTHVSPAMVNVQFELQDELEAKAAGLKMPTLVILATRDDIIDNPPVRQWFECIGTDNKELVELDAPHGIQFENQDELSGAVLGWLERWGLHE